MSGNKEAEISHWNYRHCLWGETGDKKMEHRAKIRPRENGWLWLEIRLSFKDAWSTWSHLNIASCPQVSASAIQTWVTLVVLALHSLFVYQISLSYTSYPTQLREVEKCSPQRLSVRSLKCWISLRARRGSNNASFLV